MKRLPAALLALVACEESSSNKPDPYYGTVDATAFDSRFLPVTDKNRCPKGTCYPYQAGYQGGLQIHFFNFGSTQTKSFPVDQSGATQIPVTIANSAYRFADCVQHGYDPFGDAFDRRMQYPIFAKLPLPTTNSKVFVTPAMAVYDVMGVSGAGCNDIKSASSIGPSMGPPGKFGAMAGSQAEYRIWAEIDMTALLPDTSMLPRYFGWYRGLQLQYLDGGKIPTDAGGQNLLYMDGLILNPGNGAFAKVTDPFVVILPFKPGDAGYSPIVKLHDYDLQAHGKMVQDITGVCTTPPCTDPAQPDITDPTLVGAFNTIFIIWSDQ